MLAGTLSDSTLAGVQTLSLRECLQALTSMHVCIWTHIRHELVELPHALVTNLRYCKGQYPWCTRRHPLFLSNRIEWLS